MTSSNDLPETMKALVLTSRSELPKVETIPTPQPTVGSAVVHVLVANTISYMRDIYSDSPKRPYPFPTPIVPGTAGVARVVAVGPDATKLKAGDLVYIDPLVRSRDDPTEVFLPAIHQGFTEGSAKLMRDVYRDWTYAEYCRVPIESLVALNEARLVGSPSATCCGYSLEQLSCMMSLMVPYGGLRDIELKAGQTVVVAPATGPFGGAAVITALAMGARVIAMGRNKESLANIRKRVSHPDRVETVPITGDMKRDCDELKKYGPIDAYFDIGPPEAHSSTHIKSCILALRHGARVSLMGGYWGDIAIPHMAIMHKNIRLYGKWMYEREDMADMFKLIENGLIDLKAFNIVGEYSLEQYKEAWDHAAAKAGFGETVIIKP